MSDRHDHYSSSQRHHRSHYTSRDDRRRSRSPTSHHHHRRSDSRTRSSKRSRSPSSHRQPDRISRSYKRSRSPSPHRRSDSRGRNHNHSRRRSPSTHNDRGSRTAERHRPSAQPPSRHPYTVNDTTSVKSTAKPGQEVNGTKDEPTPSTSDPFNWDLEDQEKREEALIQERRRQRRALLERHHNVTPGREPSALNGRPPVPPATPTTVPSPTAQPLTQPAAVTQPSQHPKPTPAGPFSKTEPPSSVSDQPPFALSLATGTNHTVDEYEFDDEDIFAAPVPKSAQSQTMSRASSMGHSPAVARPLTSAAPEVNPNLQDNWDDPDGYYRVVLGELFDGHYRVYNILGKGVFSTVFKAQDTRNNDLDVAIKVLRNNEVMYRAGQKEAGILKKLQNADPEDQKYCVRLLHHFEYRNHLCLVFESLSMNLRDVLKKYGRGVGINLKAVRTYTRQLFTALALLKQCRLVHADIKPDNILVNESKSQLKLADLGSAADVSVGRGAEGSAQLTPYLVSRFYRAPEIILGLPFDYAIDVWSVGCSLFELFTGQMLFPGRNNNDMLKCMMELKGRFPSRILKRAQLAAQHFDMTAASHPTFLQQETERLTRLEIIRPVVVPAKPLNDLRSRLDQGVGGNPSPKLFNAFHDFLEKCLALNPEKRMTPEEALVHPFLVDSTLL
ncbi:U4/U6 small nuclear ribonucleoprotein prp4 [Dimargaris cristalligena]|nr:U4/U6 small nuclear ribonucleoprotein prp4 [Dimargaris cristalligena]